MKYEARTEPADVIDEALLAFKPGYFATPRDLAYAAMRVAGINPPYINISLENLAQDLLENDERLWVETKPSAIIESAVAQIEAEAKEKPMAEHFKLVRVAELVASRLFNQNVSQELAEITGGAEALK